MRRSNRMPSARPVSKARFTHSLARYTAGRENEAIYWAVGHPLLDELVGRNHAGDQTHALRLFGIDHAACQDHVHCLGLTNEPREPLRRPGAGQNADG